MNRKKLKLLLLVPFFLISTLSFAGVPQINEQRILASAHNLNPQALRYAIKGYMWALANHHVNNPNILTVVDFTLPSDVKRMWVIDLRSSKVLMNLFTTQGKGSGRYYATHFSNQPGARASSLGVYKTLNTYYGAHGLSERLQGLEPGINSNAYSRAVVIHPAWYASPGFIQANHRSGCSWGCFAINPSESKRFIDITKGGTVLFAYAAPEQRDHFLKRM
jgi:hypothetical protein